VQRVAGYLAENYRPENRAYRYDFFYDNCATRLKDLLLNALPGEVKFNTTPVAVTPTFRSMLLPYMAGSPWLSLGIHLGLGSGADKPANSLQQTYLPDSLAHAYGRADVLTPTGYMPLAPSNRTLIPGQPPAPAPVDLPLWLVVAFGLVTSALNLLELTGRLRNHRIQLVLDCVWFTLAGTLGLIILLLWFGTEHRVTPANLNILWAFAPHGVVIWLTRYRKHRPWLRYYWFGAMMLALLVLPLGLGGIQYFPLTILLIALITALRAYLMVRRLSTGSVLA
jgi:Domain of unknown function (DUF4105)